MGTISVSLPSDGTTADVADYNTPIQTIVDEINGQLDNDNIASGAAISGSKVATDSITDTQLDYPRWGAEIARTTLSSAGDTITVSSIPARKYLRVMMYLLDTGGTITALVRCNNDSATNYAARVSTNGAADSTAVSDTGVRAAPATAAQPLFAYLDIENVAAQEKLCLGQAVARGTAGAGNAPARREVTGKWANTSDQITRIDIVNDLGTGDFAIGSEVIILGHD